MDVGRGSSDFTPPGVTRKVPNVDRKLRYRVGDLLLWVVTLGSTTMPEAENGNGGTLFTRTVSLAQGISVIFVLVSMVAGGAFTIGMRISQAEWRIASLEARDKDNVTRDAENLAQQISLGKSMAALEVEIRTNNERISKIADALNAALSKR